MWSLPSCAYCTRFTCQGCPNDTHFPSLFQTEDKPKEPKRQEKVEVKKTGVTKIRPNVRIEWNNGNDGRDGRYEVFYYCPGCGRCISECLVACDQCGTFFDWSKRAEIRVTRSVEWK